MTLLGNLALWLALLVGVWGALAGFVGGLKDRPDLARSARNAVFAMCGALLVAVASLEWALFQHDFNVEYVAAYTSRNLPIFYTWSALYAGQKGSLLFWATVLSLFGSLAMLLTARRHHALLPYVAGVVCTVATFFISVMLFGQANPFHRLAYTPLDGNGLNPQLQNRGWCSTPRCSTSATSRSLFLSRSRWQRCCRNDSTRTGSSRSANGRCSPGCSSRLGSASGCGGRTSSSGGGAIGLGTPSRMRRCCRGSR